MRFVALHIPLILGVKVLHNNIVATSYIVRILNKILLKIL